MGGEEQGRERERGRGMEGEREVLAGEREGARGEAAGEGARGEGERARAEEEEGEGGGERGVIKKAESTSDRGLAAAAIRVDCASRPLLGAVLRYA